jgi:hypothetical protein
MYLYVKTTVIIKNYMQVSRCMFCHIKYLLNFMLKILNYGNKTEEVRCEYESGE